jgi:pilus assembly protein CpaC
VLSALEEQRVLRKLAEPNLIAMSGETADFLAGGEYPIPVAQPSAAAAGSGVVIAPTITIVYKEFGVKLSFTPTVLSRGVISLKLMPEVSELDFTNAVSISGFLIPALTVRRARTTVELRDGQSFAIAGLLQDDLTRAQDQLPWLGSVPVIGALFRSAAYQANETELVVIVPPYLIKPVPPGKKLKTPLDSSLAGNDLDYFLNGQPEVPKTPPFTFNPFGGVQSLFGAVEPGPPVPAPVPVPVLVVAAPVPVPVAAPVLVPEPVPVPAPVPQGDGALHYDPATGYFVDPPAHGGGR